MVRNISEVKKDTDIEQSDYSGLSVIIPAAGMGRRMKSYGPKGLISLNGPSVLERQIKIIWKIYPKADITIVAGFQADLISERIRKKYDVRIVRNTDYQETNVARSIFLGLQSCVNKHALIVYGDLVFNSVALRGLVNEKSKVVVDTKKNIRDEEVGVLFNKEEVTNFSYAIDKKWCQIAYLANHEMKLFEDISSKKECERWFGYEVFNEIIEQGGSFLPVEQRGMKIAEIDTPRDLRHAIEVAITTT
jgi:choline kinase